MCLYENSEQSVGCFDLNGTDSYLDFYHIALTQHELQIHGRVDAFVR